MLSGEGNAGERWKTTIGIISKKATLIVQHFFVHFFAVVLHDYNVNTCSRSLFFHCRSLSPCIGGRLHSFCPPLQNFHVILPAEKCLLCFLSLALDLCRPFSRWAFCLSPALHSKFVDMTINLSFYFIFLPMVLRWRASARELRYYLREFDKD